MVATDEVMRGAIFVLGMHRSGTSALSRGLEVLGISLGDNLKQPVEGDNEKGFFEDWALSLINDELLALNGGQWDSLLAQSPGSDGSDQANALKLRAIEAIQQQFGGSRYFAFKDPRSCRAVPFWKDVLAKQGLRAFYVIAFRNPMSVARSLERRDSFARPRSYYLWLLHMLSAVRDTQGEARVFVEYDDLLADPGAVLDRVARMISDPHVEVAPERLRAYEREFLDTNLRHHSDRPTHLDLDNACPPAARIVYDLLRAESAGEMARPELDAAWQRSFEAFDAIAPYSVLMETLDREIRVTRAELGRQLFDLNNAHQKLTSESQELALLLERARHDFSSERASAQQLLSEIETNLAQIAERDQRIDTLSSKTLDLSSRLSEQSTAFEGERLEASEALKAANAQLERERNVTAETLKDAKVAFERERAEAAQALRRAEAAVVAERSAALEQARTLRKALIDLRVSGERASHLEEDLAVAREESLRAAANAEAQYSALGQVHDAQYSALARTYDAQYSALARAHDALLERLRAIYASSSWRLAAPLRAARTAFLGGEVNETVPQPAPAFQASTFDASAGAEASSSHVRAHTRRIHFTICAKNYLPIARTCLATSAAVHPDAEHYLVLCDEVDQGYNPAAETFSVLPVRDVAIPCFEDMALRYDVMEFNTAVKPFCFQHFFAMGADEVVYLDPDLYFLAPLDKVRAAFNGGAEAVTTPHITAPIEDERHPSDEDMLRSGAYNLGFLALRRGPDAVRFVEWWGERLRTGAVSDIQRGLFTDQKWCDLLPSFIGRTSVLRHPGYNLAYWNLMHRPVARQDGRWTAAGEPISFVHFSGASFQDANVFSKHQDRYDASSIGQLRELYDQYRDEVRSRGMGSAPSYRYSFDFDKNGKRIPPILRALYREEVAPTPATATDIGAVIRRANEPSPAIKSFRPVTITRLMHRIWKSRPDLQAAFDLNAEDGQRSYLDWCSHTFAREYALGEEFCAAVPSPPTNAIAEASPESSAPPSLASLSRRILAHSSTLRPLYRHLPAEMRHRARVMLTRSAYSTPSREAYAPQTAMPGAALVGYARGELGMGEHVRMTAASMQAEGVPMGIVNISENVLARQEDRRFDHLHSDQADFRANIFHVNADQLPIVTASLGDQFLSGKRNIAYPFWELGRFPDDWMPQLNAMDELWAPTKFIQEALATARRPVVHMPVAVELAPGYEKWSREDFGLPNGAFIFLFYFDLASFASRKNPVGVLEAFKLALGSLGARLPREVRLVVKVISADRFPHEFERLQRLTHSVPGVVLMPEVFAADEIHGLVNCADAFVSLHRSEGFGRGPAEAMRLGKVAVATGYSGNMDYMNELNSFPVPYHLHPVGADEYPYGAGQHWADPDVREAAMIMARLISVPSLAREIGARAYDYMAEHHSKDAIGRRYAERLKTIGALN